MLGWVGLLVIPLLGVIYQDFKYRAISWYWLPLILVFSVGKAMQSRSLLQLIIDSSLNLGFVLLILALVSLYFSLKNKQWVNIFKQQLGLGDALFFIAIVPFFTPPAYILFFTLSLIIVLIITIFVILFSANRKQVIPLAGGMSILFLILLIVEMVVGESIIDRQLNRFIF